MSAVIEAEDLVKVYKSRKSEVRALDSLSLQVPEGRVMGLLGPNGAALHTFVIDELDVKVEVQPGANGTATINAPAGTYTFYCDVPGHREAGMEGTLTIE